MKNRLKAILRSLGRQLSGKGDSFPYIEHFQYNSIEFNFWVTDKIYKEWYDPIGQANWVETQAYIDIIEKNDSILEIGCNNGFTTSLLKSIVGTNGLVVGMDIIPENVMIAQAQLSLNQYLNCSILHLGASDKKGKLRVQNTNNGYVVKNMAIGSIEVDVIPCDELIPRFGFFDILKIDVEGFEGNVLRGCKSLLSKSPKLIIEIHGTEIEKYNSSIDEIFSLINIDQYQGFFCLRSENVLREFKKEEFPGKSHSTLFLKAKT